MQPSQSVKGFTIAELLIVMVVIGVLAGLVITSFQNARVSAQNAQTESIVNAYKKALIAYAIQNGQYPSSWACLGEGNPDTNGDGIGECFWSTDHITEVPAFNDAMRLYLGKTNLPNASQQIVHSGSNSIRGATFIDSHQPYLDGNPHRWWISYVLKDKDSRCNNTPIAVYTGNPAPDHYDFTSSRGTTRATSLYDDGVECELYLPDPASL